MSSQILIESFCYGNIELFLKGKKINYNDEDLLMRLRENIAKCIPNREIETLWSIMHNIQNNIDVRTKNFFEFVRFLFDIFDKNYISDYTKVSFDNILTLKCFLLNDINYIIDAYSISKATVDTDIIQYYTENFRKELEYINNFRIITTFNIPSNYWVPEWTINYNQNIIKTSNIDIFLDHTIIYPNINYASNMNDILEKIASRLRFLKEHCKDYYNILEEHMYDFTSHVFLYYPYYEIAKYYECFVELSDKTFIPNDIPREDFHGLAVILYVIPLSLSSYILGFPCISMGSLSSKLTNRFAKEIISNKEKYFHNIEEKNKKIMETSMFVDNCANGVEDSDVINLLYKPIKSYNSDDITTIMSNGVYFSFTYPEYDNIWTNGYNPYNREKVPENFIKHIKSYTDSKNNIIRDCSYRGLAIKLEGTMEENFDELVQNIQIFKPTMYENDKYFERDSLINSIFNSLFT